MPPARSHFGSAEHRGLGIRRRSRHECEQHCDCAEKSRYPSKKPIHQSFPPQKRSEADVVSPPQRRSRFEHGAADRQKLSVMNEGMIRSGRSEIAATGSAARPPALSGR